jgi:hypothetical protein
VKEGPVDFVAKDGDGFGFGVVCKGVDEGFGEDGACGVLGVAWEEGLVGFLVWFGDGGWD